MSKSASWLLFAVLAACSSPVAVSLFSVKAVSPAIIEPGETLVISGDGFIEGPSTVTLTGTFRSSALDKPEKRVVSLTGQAVSENRIEVIVTKQVLKRLAKEELQFSGTVEVRFPNRLPDSPVALSATSGPVSIAFFPGGGGVQERARRVAKSKAILKKLGGTPLFAADNEGDAAVRLQTVDIGGPLYRAGLRDGGMILGVDGFLVTDLTDLAGLSPGSTHQLEYVNKDGQGGAALITVDGITNMERDQFIAVMLTAILLGLFFSRGIRPLHEQNPNLTEHLTEPAELIGLGLAGVLTIVFPGLAIAFQLQLTGTLALLGLVLTSGLLDVLYGIGPLTSRVINGGLRMVAFLAIFTGSVYSAQVIGLQDLVTAQGRFVFGAYLWQNPLILVAGLLAMVHAWPKQNDARGRSFFGILTGWLSASSMSVGLALGCLGGWSSVFWSPSGSAVDLIIAVAIVATKSWTVLLLARHVAGATKTERRRQTARDGVICWSWPLVVLLVVLGTLFNQAAPDAGLQQALQMISAGLFFSLISLFVARRLGFGTRPTPPVPNPQNGSRFSAAKSTQLTYGKNQNRCNGIYP